MSRNSFLEMSKAHNAFESVIVPVLFSHAHVNVVREITHKYAKKSLFCSSD